VRVILAQGPWAILSHVSKEIKTQHKIAFILGLGQNELNKDKSKIQFLAPPRHD
jgi:hypothetical protein